MAGIINTGGSEVSGLECAITAESAMEDEDASSDLCSALIVDEQAGCSPSSSEHNNQATTELERLKQEIMELKQQNYRLKTESEETSRRLQKKDNELSQLRKRLLSCGRCCSSVDLHDTGSWQGHSPFSPHSLFTSQTAAKPIAATAICQHKKRRINPELIVKYSDSNLSNFSSHAFSQVGKGDTFHEYLKIFPDSRGGDSQDADDCSNAVVVGHSEAVLCEHSEAVVEEERAAFGGKIPVEPTEFPVPFHISDEMSQTEKPKSDSVSLVVPKDATSKEAESESSMSKLIAEIADKSRLKSKNTVENKAAHDEGPTSEKFMSKSENASNIKSSKGSYVNSEVEKESSSNKLSPEKANHEPDSTGRPEVACKSQSPTKLSVQTQKHSNDSVDTNSHQSAYDAIKGLSIQVSSQAEVGHIEMDPFKNLCPHARDESKHVCLIARDENPDKKVSSHTKTKHSNVDKEKSQHSLQSNLDKDKSSHSSSPKSEKGRSSQSLNAKSDKDTSSKSSRSKSDKSKTSHPNDPKSDKNKSSRSHNSKSDNSKHSQSHDPKSHKSKSSQSHDPKSDKSRSSKSHAPKSEKDKSSQSSNSKPDKERTDSHKHHSSDRAYHKEGQTSKSEHHDKGRQRSASSRSKERCSKSKSKENIQEDKRNKPSSASVVVKHEDGVATVPSTPRHAAVFEANCAFENFTSNLGGSATSNSDNIDKKEERVDRHSERKIQRDEEKGDRVEAGLPDVKTSLSGDGLVEPSAQNASMQDSKSKLKDLLQSKRDSISVDTPLSMPPLQEIQKNENQTRQHAEERTKGRRRERHNSSKGKTKEVSSVKHSSKETHKDTKEVCQGKKTDKGRRSKTTTAVASQDEGIGQTVEGMAAAISPSASNRLPEQEELSTNMEGNDVHENAESKKDSLSTTMCSHNTEEHQSRKGSNENVHDDKGIVTNSKSHKNVEKCGNSKLDTQGKKKRHHSSSSSKDKDCKSHVKTEDRKSKRSTVAVDSTVSVQKPDGLGLQTASICTGPLKPFKIPKKKPITPEVLSTVETPVSGVQQKYEMSDSHKSGESPSDVAMSEKVEITQPCTQKPRLVDKSYSENIPLVQESPKVIQSEPHVQDPKNKPLVQTITEVTQPEPHGEDPRITDNTYPVNLPLLKSPGTNYPPGIPRMLDFVRVPVVAKPLLAQGTGHVGMSTVRPIREGTLPEDLHTSMEVDQVDDQTKLPNGPNQAGQTQNQPKSTLPDILLNLVSQTKVADPVTRKEDPKLAISDITTNMEQRKEERDNEKENIPLQTIPQVPPSTLPKEINTVQKVRTTYPVPKPTSVINMTSDTEHLLAYISLAKRRDKHSQINHKKGERAEGKRVGAKKPTLDDSLEGEAVYGGCLPSSVVDIQKEPQQPEEHPELRPEELEELWNQGVDVTNPEVLAEYWKMRHATERIQKSNYENFEVDTYKEIYHSSYVGRSEMTTKDTTVVTASLSEPCSPEHMEVDSHIASQDATLPQMNLCKDNQVPKDSRDDCLLKTKTIDSEVPSLKDSVELIEITTEKPEEQQSFDMETPNKIDNAFNEQCHSGKEQLPSDVELSLSLSVSTSEDSREADTGMSETQETGQATTKTGSPEKKNLERLYCKNSVDCTHLEDRHSPMEMAAEGNMQLSTDTKQGIQDIESVPNQNSQDIEKNLKERKPTHELETENYELKMFGKNSVPGSIDSSNGLQEESIDMIAPDRKRLEMELFGEDSMQVSMDASVNIKQNKQIAQTSFVTNENEKIGKETVLICEENSRGVEKQMASSDMIAQSRKRLELELFGEDSMQISMDAFDAKQKRQVVQTGLVTNPDKCTMKELSFKEHKPLLPKTEDDDQNSEDDSDLDVGDSEFAIDPASIKIDIDASEGDSVDSWVNSSQIVSEDVEHAASVDQVTVDQVIESSADIGNTPAVPLGSTLVEYSKIEVVKFHDKHLNVRSNMAEHKVPNENIECNGFAEDLEHATAKTSQVSERDSLPNGAKENSDIKKDEDNVNTDKYTEIGNQTVMKIPHGANCPETHEMAKHGEDNVRTKIAAKTLELDVTDEGKDVDITGESVFDIEGSSDVSSEGVCAGDEMSEDQDSTLIDDPCKDDDGREVNDTCSLASESGGSSLHCTSTTEDELDEIDEDIPSNDSLDKTLLKEKNPELATDNVDEGQQSECDDVLDLHAGDLSMFDEESMPPAEMKLTPRRSPRKKPSTSTPRTTKHFRTPKKDKTTPRTAKLPRTPPIKDKSTRTSRLRTTSSRSPAIERRDTKKSSEREIEEGEAFSDGEEYTPRQRDKISHSRSRTPPSHHHHSRSNKRRRSVSKERDGKRVCHDKDRRIGSSRRHDSPSSRYGSRRDSTSYHRYSRHHPRRSPSPQQALSGRRSGRSENYSHSRRDSRRDNPRTDLSVRRR